MVSYLLAILAGSLSTINPCVLPLLPIVVGSALAKNRFGPLAMAGGLTLSFTLVGLSVALLGSSLGISDGVFRIGGGILLLLFGLILVSRKLTSSFASWATPISTFSDKILSHKFFASPAGLFFTGALLGAVWSPCSGPTLGAAIGLVSQQKEVLHGVLIMLFFGMGASMPLLAIGYGGRELMRSRRDSLLYLSRYVKLALGWLFLVIGVLILTGYDRVIEAWMLDNMPEWLISLTVSV